MSYMVTFSNTWHFIGQTPEKAFALFKASNEGKKKEKNFGNVSA